MQVEAFADLDADELVTVIIQSRAIMLRGQPWGTALGDIKERITWLTSRAPVVMVRRLHWHLFHVIMIRLH